MLAGNNKERLEQEISYLIGFIAEGREFFFKQTGLSIESGDNWLNHFVCKELFQKHPELIQLELNIQLLYIKLASYYRLVDSGSIDGIKKQRNAFAHDLTDLIFSKRVKYNFFLHKVAHNFKKIQFVFYEEGAVDLKEDGVKSLDLDLDGDIRNFLAVWSGPKLKS